MEKKIKEAALDYVKREYFTYAITKEIAEKAFIAGARFHAEALKEGLGAVVISTQVQVDD